MTGPAPTTAPHRRGPRPLLLHLGLATLQSMASHVAWPNSKPGSPGWNAILDPAKAVLATLGESTAPDPGPHAALAERLGASLRQNRELIAGIAAYRRHPWRRAMADPPAIWAEGDTRLLDYGGTAAGKPAILFVPSLVNGARVLDLMADHSMLRSLAAGGARPLLLDWGWPGELERTFTLTEYVAGRLERAIGAAVAAVEGPIVLAGYCMGGTLAVAAAQRQQPHLRGLVLLAAPWDFHAGEEAERARLLASLMPLLEPLMGLNATLPVDALQTLFGLLDPGGVAAKYRAFARLDPESERARLFVALEDWLNDGVPLAAPAARECLIKWYGENQPMRGVWQVAGLRVDPGAIRLPCLVVAPARDRIVPPQSASPLAALIPGATLQSPPAGHVGMVAGARAEATLWHPLLSWLRAL